MIVNETDSLVFIFPEDQYSEQDLLWIVKEDDRWKPLQKGWEYSLYHDVGERGGRAEAKELIVNGNLLSIEDYVKRCQAVIAQKRPIHLFFQQFTMTITAKINKTESTIAESYFLRQVEGEWGFAMIERQGNSTIYRKEIMLPEQLFQVPITWGGDNVEYEVIILPK